VAAWGGNGYSDVTWNPTVNEGGSHVEAYIVRASNGAEMRVSNEQFWKNAYVKFTGLPNGQLLTFTVAAVNQQGVGEASLPSQPVTLSDAPLAPIAAPENVTVHPGKGAVSIHFQLPPGLERREGNEEPDSGSKGVSSPILAYAITVNPGGRKVLFTGRNIVVLEGRHASFNVVDGLQSSVEYTFSVSAVGNGGEGAPAVVGPVRIP
jgi:hypothetical protein